jgi:hypothetical protein
VEIPPVDNGLALALGKPTERRSALATTSGAPTSGPDLLTPGESRVKGRARR